MGIADYYTRRLLPTQKSIRATLTRPADTTPYSQSDAVSNSTSSPTVISWSNVAARPGGAFRLEKLVYYSSSSLSAGKSDLFLFILNTAHTVPNDNAAWAPDDATCRTIIDCIYLPVSNAFITTNSASGASGNGLCIVTNLNSILQCAAGSTTLYLQPRIAGLSGYTPVSAEEFYFDLIGEQL